ncbi:MAG: 16S rRNA (cytidine(1402)-2'-O)-methyltransferase [Paracoccaceae bacterium]
MSDAYKSQPRAMAPGLYIVSTPIGAARDITLRALDVLAGAEVLAAEDTRTLRHLMELHGIALNGRRIVPYHEHNGARALPRLLADLQAGKTVAYAAEAGTPLVSDPGFELTRAAREMGLPVYAAPGASAVLAALAVAGLPTDRFLFAGFPPAARTARLAFLRELAPVQATVVLYESPNRINQILDDLAETHGKDRLAALCRELTKRFEEVTRGTIAQIRDGCAGRDIKGECVLVIDRAAAGAADAETVERALDRALDEMTVKDAAAAVAEAFSLSRREVYQMALKRGKT